MEILKVVQWSCNRLPCKLTLLNQFLAKQNPDIFLLNEIKMSKLECNYYSSINGYNTLFKPRLSPTDHRALGDGVAILIRKGIEYFQDLSFDSLGLELLCIVIKLRKRNFQLLHFTTPLTKNFLLTFSREFVKPEKIY